MKKAPTKAVVQKMSPKELRALVISGNELIYDKDNETFIDQKGNSILKFMAWHRVRKFFKRKDDSTDWQQSDQATVDMCKFMTKAINDKLQGKSVTLEYVVSMLQNCEHLAEALTIFKQKRDEANKS